MTYELLLEKNFLAWKFCIVYCTATGVLIFIELLHFHFGKFCIVYCTATGVLIFIELLHFTNLFKHAMKLKTFPPKDLSCPPNLKTWLRACIGSI